MAFMEWNSSLDTGVSRFDNDHKRLVELINMLHDAMESDAGENAAGEIANALVAYTKTHFAAEEQQMQLYDYPDYICQKREHNALILQVCDMQKKLVGGDALPINLMQFMKDWLTIHIMGDDKKYGPFFSDKNTESASGNSLP